DRERGHYLALQEAIRQDLVSAAHGIYRGGLGIHLILMALAGDLGLEVDLSRIPASPGLRPDKILFSETCGRVLLTVDPQKQEAFERQMAGCICRPVGLVTKTQRVQFKNEGQALTKTRLKNFRAAFHRPFGDLA
ncbi:MAG TPA: AIR synthase-related protein, partial [Thermodesulfobacteriota bacterium]|nr:AIR synthase-related protein [Thermodesulfobacteriota bacterium]